MQKQLINLILITAFFVLGRSSNTADAQTVTGGRYHSVFACSNGTVRAVGANILGQLGDGSTLDRTNPVQVSGLLGITSVAGGGEYSIFLKNDGTVWSVGFNGLGQLGDGT